MLIAMTMSKQDELAVNHLEHQILALEKEWMNYEDTLFVDWNAKFAGRNPQEIRNKILSPGKEILVEKKEFYHLWHRTIRTFRRCAQLLGKGRREKALEIFTSEISALKEEVTKLESMERRTLEFLEDNMHVFQDAFDRVYGEGYFEREVYGNYELRFKILTMSAVKNLFNDVS